MKQCFSRLSYAVKSCSVIFALILHMKCKHHIDCTKLSYPQRMLKLTQDQCVLEMTAESCSTSAGILSVESRQAAAAVNCLIDSHWL